MLYAPLYLRRTTNVVGAVVSGFTLITHKLRPTFWTAGDEPHGACVSRTARRIDAYYLRYDFPTLLNVHVITLMQV